MEKTNKPLVSIIIPVYKVEKYLDTCLNSVAKQTYSNLEVMLIDDGSPDNSGLICDKYAEADVRFHVIHKQNAGTSSARNTGILASHGSLVSFVDPDDYLDATFIENLVQTLLTTGSDITYCLFRKVDESGDNILSEPEACGTINTYGKEAALINCLTAKDGFGMFVWNGLFKREVLPLFDEKILICEDQGFSVGALMNADKVAFDRRAAAYNYRIRTSGSKSAFNFYTTGYKFQLMALEEIHKYLISSSVSPAVYTAYHERCLRMYLGLMDRYCNIGEVRDRQLFLMLRSHLVEEARKTYAGLWGYLLALVFSSGEKAYKFIFRIIKSARSRGRT